MAIPGSKSQIQASGKYTWCFWLIANPLLMLGLYVFAFGIVFGGRFTDSPDESTIDYALGVFVGLSVLGIISGTIGSAPGTIVSQPNFVKKVVFPLEVLPAANTGSLAYDLLIGLSLCFWVFSSLVRAYLFLFFLFQFDCSIFLISLGFAWFFSALGVFIRDITQLGSFLGLALLYSSGVFYSAAKAKTTAPAIWSFLKWNPFLQIIDSLRQVILWGGEPDWNSVIYCWIFGLFCLFFGSWFFNRLRPAFADVL